MKSDIFSFQKKTEGIPHKSEPLQSLELKKKLMKSR